MTAKGPPQRPSAAFSPLARLRCGWLPGKNFRAIAELMLGEVKEVLAQRNVAFSWDESLLDYLVKEAYSVTYGARNLRRLIQKQVEDVLAQRIIDRHGEGTKEILLSAPHGTINMELRG